MSTYLFVISDPKNSLIIKRLRVDAFDLAEALMIRERINAGNNYKISIKKFVKH